MRSDVFKSGWRCRTAMAGTLDGTVGVVAGGVGLRARLTHEVIALQAMNADHWPAALQAGVILSCAYFAYNISCHFEVVDV